MFTQIPRLSLFVFVCLLSACGGGGGEDELRTVQPPAPDQVSAYVGTWRWSCAVTSTLNPTNPGGLSEDEVMKLTKISNTRFEASFVRYVYNNTMCSTHTSHYTSFPMSSKGEVVGEKAVTGVEAGKLYFQPDDNTAAFRALALVKGGQLFMTRSNEAGVTLDAEGYPQVLDESRAFDRFE